MGPSASATAVGDPGSLSPYWRFHQAVAEAQLASWLPRESRLLVDISGPRARAADIAAASGHTVLRVAEAAAPGPAGDSGTPIFPPPARRPYPATWSGWYPTRRTCRSCAPGARTG